MDLRQIKSLNISIEKLLLLSCKDFSLTSAQIQILTYLSQHPDKIICQKDLELALSLSHPTVSASLRKLEKQNLLSTHQLIEDKRFREIRLTSESLSLLKELRKRSDSILSDVFKGFSPNDLQTFQSYLYLMQTNLNTLLSSRQS